MKADSKLRAKIRPGNKEMEAGIMSFNALASDNDKCTSWSCVEGILASSKNGNCSSDFRHAWLDTNSLSLSFFQLVNKLEAKRRLVKGNKRKVDWSH